MNPFKKGQIYKKDSDTLTIIEVLGDVVFYGYDSVSVINTSNYRKIEAYLSDNDWKLVEPKVEPLKELKVGETFFLADPTDKLFYLILYFTGESSEIAQLERGLCFSTKDSAIAKAKEMLEAGKGDK